MSETPPRIAVLIPCYNEEAAIAQTVADFRAALPMATIYVYDNNSKDQTVARAKEAGDVKTIAFPAISTGVYRFPKYDAARIALTSMLDHESEYSRVIACLFDEDDAALYREMLASLRRSR